MTPFRFLFQTGFWRTAWLTVGLVASTAVQAQDRGVFDIYLGAVPVGVFAFSGVEARGQYSLAGQLRTTGLVGSLTRVRYDARARGRRLGERYVPMSYDELAVIGERQTHLSITYQDGVPARPVFSPDRVPDRPDVDPAAQGDAVDLLTGLYALFRDLPEQELCQFRSFIFDGARRTSIVLRPLRQNESEAYCAAEYRRLEGFTERELARRAAFDFQLVYEPLSDDRWRVIRADVETVYGVVTLQRRRAR